MKVGASTIDTNDRFWSAATVAAVIGAKKAKKQQSGKAVNTFVLRYYDTDAPEHIPEDEKFELEKFLLVLKESIGKGNFDGNNLDTNRFQVLVQNGAHWTPLDITIRDGNLHFISMDAAGSPSEMDTLRAIEKHFPSASRYCLSTECSTQMDDNSCSRFSLDMAFKMLSIKDPIAMLEEHTAQTNPRNLAPKGSSAKDILLAPKDIPDEMTFLFRNVQSGTRLKELPEPLLHRKVKSTGETLAEYAESHTAMQSVGGQQKKRYQAIEAVKTKMSADTELYLQSLSEDQKSTIREQAKGYDYISQTQAQRAQMNQLQREAVPASQQEIRRAEKYIYTHKKKTGPKSFFTRANAELHKAEKIVARSKAQKETKSERPKSRRQQVREKFNALRRVIPNPIVREAAATAATAAVSPVSAPVDVPQVAASQAALDNNSGSPSVDMGAVVEMEDEAKKEAARRVDAMSMFEDAMKQASSVSPVSPEQEQLEQDTQRRAHAIDVSEDAMEAKPREQAQDAQLKDNVPDQTAPALPSAPKRSSEAPETLYDDTAVAVAPSSVPPRVLSDVPTVDAAESAPAMGAHSDIDNLIENCRNIIGKSMQQSNVFAPGSVVPVTFNAPKNKQTSYREEKRKILVELIANLKDISSMVEKGNVSEPEYRKMVGALDTLLSKNKVLDNMGQSQGKFTKQSHPAKDMIEQAQVMLEAKVGVQFDDKAKSKKSQSLN